MRKEVEAKERSSAISACFNDYHENDENFNFSSSALFSQGKIFSKHRCVFCNKNNHTSNKCLKTSEPIANCETKTFMLFVLRKRTFGGIL